MNCSITKKELRESEKIILKQQDNFQALFMAVLNLKDIIEEKPDIADFILIQTLEKILLSPLHTKQSKSFFLFREVAKILITIINEGVSKRLTNEALSALSNIIKTSSNSRLRAVAEAAGTLPLNICTKELPGFNLAVIPEISFNEILQKQNIKSYDHKWLGRSLISSINKNKLLVIKMAKQTDCLLQLNSENRFMEFLNADFKTDKKFLVPFPVKVSEHFLFSIKDLPLPAEKNLNIHRKNYCIAFIADKEYFIYPNEKNDNCDINENIFEEMILRNSSLLGELSGMGYIHTAPVPLFHNRVQQDRRKDNGLYEWDKGGRLDKWLESCRYPNFGKSGIRDFEHIENYNGNSLKLYKNIGSHILSLILVTGSFFRNIGKDNHDDSLVSKTGFDDNKNPLDTRSLFNPQLFENVLNSALKNYFAGFTNIKEPFNIKPDYTHLTKKLINEMGVDKHMEEIIRVADQKAMTDNEFGLFLLERGFNQNKIPQFQKGEKDIITLTGPHLGGFNQKISIPEVTDLLAAFSALCIIGKFTKEKGL